MTESTPNAWLPVSLRKLAGRALQTALNHSLALDPDTAHKLAALEGRRVELHLHGPDIALAIQVFQGKLEVGPPASDSQLRVAATPGSLLAMLLSRRDEGIAPGKVEIAGDADLARRLEKLASGFAPDFEEAFARTFGDVIGVPLAQALRKALTRARQGTEHLSEDTADWLRDEARLTPARSEIDDFLDGVDRLRERSERFEARLMRLEQKVRARRQGSHS